MPKDKTIREVLEELSCPECKAYFGEGIYKNILTQALSEIREVMPSEEEIAQLALGIYGVEVDIHKHKKLAQAIHKAMVDKIQ